MGEHAQTYLEALAAIQDDMRKIVADEDDPYEAGSRIYSTAMSAVGDPDDVMHPTWLAWGALTDWVEMKPEEAPEAHAAMRRAAHEWLSLGDDSASRHAYFDRWLYDELGYERPRR